jgi:hypothetical protein
MSGISPISSISSSLIAASAQFTAAGGATVAAANGDQGALAAAIVQQAQAGVQLQAAANIEKVANEMTSVLLDITV